MLESAKMTVKQALLWMFLSMMWPAVSGNGRAFAGADPSTGAGNVKASSVTLSNGEPRLDPNSQKAHAQLLAKAKSGGIDIYFEGDSITRRWGASDPQYKALLANWNENFFGWNAANFGWGGDTVRNVLWRIQNGELDGVHPKIIVLMAGTNDLEPAPGGNGKETRVDEVARGLEAILGVMQEKAPGAVIILMGITPRAVRGSGASMPIVNRVNERISHLADGRRVRFLNINKQLEDGNGGLLEGMTVDGLHLTVKGYQVWANALKPIFAELLGPPAGVDHAPPPTGDPSAQRPTVVPQ